MFKNYLKVSFRNLVRNKLFSLLNLLGLSVGLASFFVIYLFVQNELNFDVYHEKSDRIFRVSEWKEEGRGHHYGGLTAALAVPASEMFPEIEAYTRIEAWNKTIVFQSLNDSSDSFKNLSVDSGFFDLFDLDIIDGKEPDFEKEPNSALISQRMAERYFKNKAVGEVISVRKIQFSIVGVYENLPANSSLQGDFIFDIEGVNQWRESSFSSFWEGYFDQTYFLLKDPSKAEELAPKIESFFNDQYGGNLEKSFIGLQPLADIHFNSEIEDNLGQKSDRQYIYIFSSVAFFILLCSFFNYVSMAVAQSFERTKEIGIRKVLGANRQSVYKQFLLESLILIIVSVVVSLVLVEVLVPELELLINRQIDTSITNSTLLWAQAFLFILVVTMAAAVYPALISGKTQISHSLRNSGGKNRHLWLRAFNVFQIVIFMVLTSVAVVSQKQLRFMQNDNLGFDKENQMVIRPYKTQITKYADVLKNDFLKIPGVESITRARSMPSSTFGTMSIAEFDDAELYNFPIGVDYLETMGMELIEGRDFLDNDVGLNRILLNETAVKNFGLKGEVIGRVIKTFNREFTVIGVVSDFHVMSKKEAIKPIMFHQIGVERGAMIIKIASDNFLATTEAIKETYESVTGETIKFSFLDEQVDALYQQETVVVKMIQAGTLMAAIVACLGLFGMAGYATKRRLKEMGIRKVLGAGFVNIQHVLNYANIVNLSIAALFAIPLIYYGANDWLNSFAYRIDFPFLVVVVTIVIVAIVTMITAIYHSTKAYLINPVEILKDE
ncbi:ABC transporter permease [Roseivirga sp.]|uniref:ABC transporter permease n=1 Tax=Roseivirga sp. TaxID=1964215 RepID=UPI003B8ABBDF